MHSDNCKIILSFMQRAIRNEDTTMLGEAPYDASHLRRIKELYFFIWHDTLKELRAIPIKGDRHQQLKKTAVSLWVAHGNALGLEEGKNVLSIRLPSKITKENEGKPYWRLDRRCFWTACPCAALMHTAHHVRVCKGCWRVLYCGKKCQAL